MNTIENRLRDATEDVHTAVATLKERAVPRTGRRLTPLVAVALGIAAVLLVGLPLIVLRGGSTLMVESQQPAGALDTPPVQTETTPPAQTLDQSEVPAIVLDYWALEGRLQSVGDEEGWLCPVGSAEGYTFVVDDVDMPQELKLDIPGLDPVEVFNRDDGPACHQPHLLVMIASADEGSGLIAEAGMTVWPRVTRFEDICSDDCGFVGGPINELTINDQPARLQLHSETGHYDIWWIDYSGTPMYAETSGLDRDRILELVEAISVDPSTRRATIEPKAQRDMEMFSNQASIGVWETGYWRYATYEIEGTNVSITTRYDVTFEPYAQFAPFVDFLTLVDVHNTSAVWTPEAGNVLTFTNTDGIHIWVGGAPTIEDATTIAELLP